MLEKTEREIKNGQSRDTGNIGYTRHMTKTNKKHTHTSQKTKTRSNTNPTKTPGGERYAYNSDSAQIDSI